MKKLSKYLFVFIFLFILNISKVDAKEIIIDEVINKFQEMLNIESSGNNIVKLEENKIVVYNDDQKIIEYNYENNVISHSLTIEIEDPDSEEGFGKIFESVMIEMYNLNLLNTVAYLHGYSERDIRLFSSSDAIMDNSNFDTNGYVFSVNEDTENKIILDFKIDIQKFKLVVNYNNAKAPELKFYDIEEDSISIQTLADLEDAKTNNALDEDGYVMVEVYRSKDGENFEYVFSVSADTGDGALTALDSDLEPGTTYYYKAVVEYSKNFSEVYEVKTLGEQKNPIQDEMHLNTTNEGVSINIKTSLEDGTVLTIYKSSDNINFEVLDNVAVVNHEINYLDKNVSGGTTYYYKVSLNNQEIFKVTEIKYEKTSVEDNKLTENPKTGIKDNLILITMMGLIGFGTLKVINKKNKLNRI